MATQAMAAQAAMAVMPTVAPEVTEAQALVVAAEVREVMVAKVV